MKQKQTKANAYYMPEEPTASHAPVNVKPIGTVEYTRM